MSEVVNLVGKLALFDDLWSPHIVAQMNDVHVKLVKVQGEFVQHCHEDTDELFQVLAGTLEIDLPDGRRTLGPGELLVVPAGVEHRPVAEEPCHLLLLEPTGTVNTGAMGDGTEGTWI